MARKRKTASLIERRNRSGYLFVSHWILGLLLFFLIPAITSILYSFSEVVIDENGVTLKPVWFEHFRTILVEDADYVNNLKDAVTSLVLALPIIICLSLFLAVILNSDFRGRTIFRGIFFLPVILANSVVMSVLNNGMVDVPLFTVSSGQEYNYGGMIDFNAMLTQLNLPGAISDLFANLLGDMFNLIWSCGVQTILFLAGLQSIPKQLYEVGKIEGASRWETFWILEVPSLRNIISLVLIYTMVDQFTALDSPVIMQVNGLMNRSQIYDQSSAMLWGYFLIVGLVLGIILVLYNKFCVKRWE